MKSYQARDTDVLLLDLGFLLRSEVVDNVEHLADFLGLFPLDHVRHRLAPNVPNSELKKVARRVHDQLRTGEP